MDRSYAGLVEGSAGAGNTGIFFEVDNGMTQAQREGAIE
jgi:hypothetical protein